MGRALKLVRVIRNLDPQVLEHRRDKGLVTERPVIGSWAGPLPFPDRLPSCLLHFPHRQLASGLALMFCGVGLSALLGSPYVGSRIAGLLELSIPWLSELPVLGPMLFQHDALVYAAVPVALLTRWVLFSTRWWLALRVVGENPAAACDHAMRRSRRSSARRRGRREA